MLKRPNRMLFTFLCNKIMCYLILMTFASHKKEIYIS